MFSKRKEKINKQFKWLTLEVQENEVEGTGIGVKFLWWFWFLHHINIIYYRNKTELSIVK